MAALIRKNMAWHMGSAGKFWDLIRKFPRQTRMRNGNGFLLFIPSKKTRMKPKVSHQSNENFVFQTQFPFVCSIVGKIQNFHDKLYCSLLYIAVSSVRVWKRRHFLNAETIPEIFKLVQQCIYLYITMTMYADKNPPR